MRRDCWLSVKPRQSHLALALCCQRLPRALQCQQSRGSVKRLPSRKICDGKGRRSVIREYPINGTGFHGTVSATRPIALKVTMIYAI